MRSDIKEIFDRYIEDTFKEKYEVKKFLLRHERKDLCLDYLSNEIHKIERGLIKFNSIKYRQVIHTVARMYCEACLRQREDSLLTANEKQRRIKEADSLKDAEDYLKEVREEVKSL